MENKINELRIVMENTSLDYFIIKEIRSKFPKGSF